MSVCLICEVSEPTGHNDYCEACAVASDCHYHPDHDSLEHVSDWIESDLRDMFAGEVLVFGSYKVGRGLFGGCYWYVTHPCGYHCESLGAAATAVYLRDLLNIRRPFVDHEGDVLETFPGSKV